VSICGIRNTTSIIKKATKQEYEKYAEDFKSYPEIQKSKAYFQKFQLQFPRKYIHGVQNENAKGEYLTQCKDAISCFDSAHLWDCKYVHQAFNPVKDAMDIQECGDAERLYECAFVGYDAFNMKFSVLTLGAVSDSEYCSHCPHSSHLFGCIGMRHKEYCILNKQYTEEEYNALIPRIHEHMKQTGEYGEFFPIEFSNFAYNESMAQWYYPLTKEEALAKGYRWREEQKFDDSGITKRISAAQLPNTIDKVPDDILNWAVKCEESGRLFRINKMELKLYRQMNLPIPHLHWEVRHDHRVKKRNPRKLWKRNCQKCSSEIETSYAPERPEIVYCESCYRKAVE